MSFHFVEPYQGNYCVKKALLLVRCLRNHLATPGQIHGNYTNYAWRAIPKISSAFQSYSLKSVSVTVKIIKMYWTNNEY